MVAHISVLILLTACLLACSAPIPFSLLSSKQQGITPRFEFSSGGGFGGGGHGPGGGGFSQFLNVHAFSSSSALALPFQQHTKSGGHRH
ncbi:hypothetical protein QCA50_016096 [Cerrena zonata]|uniref:Uncharacterized protein n=1 Tax=Cerrena zonata TaxID=2478898 RepID=A0AAW0FI52_9APHY